MFSKIDRAERFIALFDLPAPEKKALWEWMKARNERKARELIAWLQTDPFIKEVVARFGATVAVEETWMKEFLTNDNQQPHF